VTWHDTTLARRPGRNDEPKIKTLIELTTFAIVSPSSGRSHPTGRPYVRLSGGFSTIAGYSADERTALIDLARSFDAMPKPEALPPLLRTPSHREDRPGDDFDRRTTWYEVLEPFGWTHVFDRGDVGYWRRQGKTSGVSATTNFGGTDRLHVFSTSTQLPPDHSYSKFSVLTFLAYGGDFKRAAASLAKRSFRRQDDARGEPRALKADHAASRVVHLTPASQIAVRPVRWLWQGRLALQALSLLGGREDVGKTTLGYTLGAAVTRGDLPGVCAGSPRGVVVAATEDSWSHTIVPRLMAAGADLNRVFRVDVTTSDGTETELSLPRDLIELERVIAGANVALVILDPLLSRLDAALDTHKDAEVRLALEPLVTLADKADVCVLGLIHVNKSNSSDVLTLLMGSRAFAAVARTVLFVMVDPDDENRRLLAVAKNNLGRSDLPTLAFAIRGVRVATTIEGEVWTGKLDWLGESERSIRDAVEAAAERSGQRTAVSEAASWLAEYLASEGGTVDSAVVKREGAKYGHSREALRRACQKLRVSQKNVGYPRRTLWSLSATPDVGRPHSAVSTVSTMATGGEETGPTSAPLDRSPQWTQSREFPGGSEAAAEDLPAWVTESAEPDFSDPIGEREEQSLREDVTPGEQGAKNWGRPEPSMSADSSASEVQPSSGPRPEEDDKWHLR
jgi:hypothetical protein